MCLQDLKIGRHKYTRTVYPLVTIPGTQRPGAQTTIPVPQISFSLPRMFIGANGNRTALRLVLANPGLINEETGLFEPRETYVTGYPWNGVINPTGTIEQPLFAAMSVCNRANMVDFLRIEDFGGLITGPWMFIPMWIRDADIPFGGYSVWDVQGDDTLIHAVQGEPQV